MKNSPVAPDRPPPTIETEKAVPGAAVFGATDTITGATVMETLPMTLLSTASAGAATARDTFAVRLLSTASGGAASATLRLVSNVTGIGGMIVAYAEARSARSSLWMALTVTIAGFGTVAGAR